MQGGYRWHHDLVLCRLAEILVLQGFQIIPNRDAAFRDGEAAVLRAARRKLIGGIKKAKSAYALRIQGHFNSNDPRSMWKGIRCITDYKKSDAQCPEDPALPIP